MHAIWQVQEKHVSVVRPSENFMREITWHVKEVDTGRCQTKDIQVEKTARWLIDFYKCIHQIPYIIKTE